MKSMTFRQALPGTAATICGLVAGMAEAQGAFDTDLTLDPSSFTTLKVTLDDKPMSLRRYDVVYIGKPVAMAAEQPARGMGPGGSLAKAETQTLKDLLAYQRLAYRRERCCNQTWSRGFSAVCRGNRCVEERAGI